MPYASGISVALEIRMAIENPPCSEPFLTFTRLRKLLTFAGLRNLLPTNPSALLPLALVYGAP
jgi:hypothetical protein